MCFHLVQMRQMYKTFVLLVLCATHEILGVKNVEISPEELKMIKNLHDSCVEQTGVSESAIAEVNKRNYNHTNTDYKLKCYMACMLTTIGVLDDDGVFDHDAFIDIVIDPMKEMANKMKAHCEEKIKNVHTGDICETGYKIHLCIREASPDTYKLF